jgi:hypothetical protein
MSGFFVKLRGRAAEAHHCWMRRMKIIKRQASIINLLASLTPLCFSKAQHSNCTADQIKTVVICPGSFLLMTLTTYPFPRVCLRDGTVSRTFLGEAGLPDNSLKNNEKN